jgi:HD-GYP domain-containing protein (c-di-GMP phosphodiesterase class II)
MREHVTIGARILEPLSAFAFAIPVARHHHEWWDGRGYPEGLAGEQIPVAARIVAVADVFDSLASERPYRAAWRLDRVIEFIRDGASAQFDPHVVEAFLRVMEEEGRIPPRVVGPPTLDAAVFDGAPLGVDGGES